MNKIIKMVGLDLDGTLLTSEKKVTDYTKNILEKAIAQGCNVLHTMQRHSSVRPEHREQPSCLPSRDPRPYTQSYDH